MTRNIAIATLFATLVGGAALTSTLLAQTQEQFAVNNRPTQLTVCPGSSLTADNLENQEPFQTGVMHDPDFLALIGYETPGTATCVNKPSAGGNSWFGAPPPAPTTDTSVTIFHILRWADATHQNVKFQSWYIYDPARNDAWTYLKKQRTAYETGTYIAGRQSFRLIAVHLDSQFLGSTSESFSGVAGGLKLKHPFGYKVNIAKTQTQLQQDASTVLSILGLTKAAAAPADNLFEEKLAPPPPPGEIGYFLIYDFHSAMSTSNVTVSVSLPADNPSKNTPDPTLTSSFVANPNAVVPKAKATKGAKASTGAQGGSGSQANSLGSQTYHNEKPALFGLSAVVPITSYKDLTYSAGAVSPTTVNRQNIYITGNLYLPPVAIGSTSFRWLPHPFVGLPIKGQPLRNSLYGISAGWQYFEPFFGVVLDVQQIKDAAGNPENHFVRKGVYGVSISISALSKALSSGSK